MCADFAQPPRRDTLLGLILIGISLIGFAKLEASESPMQPKDWVLADVANGRLEEHDLFTAAVIISGAESPGEIESYQRRLEVLAAAARERLGLFKPSQNSKHTAVDRARAVLRLLHDELLTGQYDAGCGDIRRAFDSGDFNCATATLLFQSLLRRCDLSAKTVALPGHVRCRIADATIETTHRSGRLPDDSSIDADDGSEERKLNDVQLLAKLLYNQGLSHLASQRFADSLEATELSWQLDREHIAARQNVAAVINNWALRLSTPGTYEQAIQLLQRGQAVDPGFGLLAINERMLWQAWWVDANANGDAVKAAEIRQRANRLFPDLTW